MVYYSEYHNLVWFTIVNTMFTMVYYSKYHILLWFTMVNYAKLLCSQLILTTGCP